MDASYFGKQNVLPSPTVDQRVHIVKDFKQGQQRGKSLNTINVGQGYNIGTQQRLQDALTYRP
jgi:hypothetical protein